MKSIT